MLATQYFTLSEISLSGRQGRAQRVVVVCVCVSVFVCVHIEEAGSENEK